MGWRQADLEGRHISQLAGYFPSDEMGMSFFAIILLLPCVISMPSRLTEETKEKKISQEAESVGISLWDFAHKDFDVLNILRKSAPRTSRTILDRFAKDIKFRNEENFSDMFQEGENSDKNSDGNSKESKQRSAAKTIFEHFMMKGHQRYMYPLTVDYSHGRKEEDAVFAH